MSFRRLIVCFSFLAIFAMATRVSVDTDTWWHLRAGAWMVEQGQVLRTDHFSLTRQGEPWVYSGWLAQVILYTVYQLLGFAGLNILTALMVVLVFAFVWPLLEAPPLLRTFVIFLAATVSSVYWSARPHIFSFVLAAIYLWILARASKGGRAWLWVLPPLMALWSNLHGGFAIGFILVAIYLIGEVLNACGSVLLKTASVGHAWREYRTNILALVVIGLACAVAVMINPHGLQMMLYPFKTVSVGVLQDYIQEWQSPNFHRIEVQPFIWMLFLCIVSLALSRRRKETVELILVISFAYMSFLAGRNIALFALVAAPVLAQHGYSAIQPLLEGKTSGPQLAEGLTRKINLGILTLLTLAALAKIAIPLSDQVNREAIADQIPVEAIAYLRRQPSRGPMFNSYNWGGYVLWELYPEYLSFVDGRTDLFDDEILTEYLLAWRADRGWEQVIDRWDIQIALLEPSAPLARAMDWEGWIRIYADDQAVILYRGTEP